MVCPGPTGCCGTCSASPKLADGVGDASAPSIELASQQANEPFICRDSDDCQLRCTPPSGRRLEMVGVLARSRDIPVLLVERWRFVP
jgi:hypothetical protein